MLPFLRMGSSIRCRSQTTHHVHAPHVSKLQGLLWYCPRIPWCTFSYYSLNFSQTSITNSHSFQHCQIRRPRSVKCVGCDREFLTLSAAFNHLESSNCESGITRQNIEEFATEFLKARDVEGLSCPSCDKVFSRMCDLMQHAETPSCKDGYWKGSGTVGQLVEHIMARIRPLVPAKKPIVKE